MIAVFFALVFLLCVQTHEGFLTDNLAREFSNEFSSNILKFGVSWSQILRSPHFDHLLTYLLYRHQEHNMFFLEPSMASGQSSVSRRRPSLSIDTFLANHNGHGRAFDTNSSKKGGSSDSKREESGNKILRISKCEVNDFNVRLFKDNDPHIRALERLYLRAYYGPDSPGSSKQLILSPPSTPSHTAHLPPISTSYHAGHERSPNLYDSDITSKPMNELHGPIPSQFSDLDDSRSTSWNDVTYVVASSEKNIELHDQTEEFEHPLMSLQEDQSEEKPLIEGIAKVNLEERALTTEKIGKSASKITTPLRLLPRRVFAYFQLSTSTNNTDIMKIPRKSVGSGSSKSAWGSQRNSDNDLHSSLTNSLESSPSSDVPSLPGNSESAGPCNEEKREHGSRYKVYAVQKVIHI